ncbi:MAG: caspase family protein [Acidobacteriia bacterium]|nr:caspase family protein [Terriglobia bacterium]
MWILPLTVLAAVLVTGAWPQSNASAVRSRRVALVLGNTEYPANRLVNPAHDAEDMKAALERMGFRVTAGTNLGLRAMNERIQQFVSDVQTGDVALVYFAGHGMQVDGENLLVPVDFAESMESSAKSHCVRFDELQHSLEKSAARVSILIMDACRENPYHRTRSWGRGMAPVEAGLGSYIAFATSPGSTASENPTERNGLFTKYLLQTLRQPPPLSQLFRTVRDEVWTASRQQQRPYIEDQLIGDFNFTEQAGAAASATNSGLQQPGTPQDLLENGRLLYQQGNCAGAVQSFDRAVRLVPENAFAQNAAGMAYACQNLQNQALERFNMAIRLQPDMASAYHNRGVAYLMAGRYELAAEDFTWAIEQDPGTSTNYVRRGEAYFASRKYMEAAKDFSRAIDLNPADAEAYHGRGQVSQRLGKYQEALSDYNAALERRPGFFEASRDLEALLARTGRH